MGKILIINGADFSVNAIEQVGNNIAGVIPIVRNYNRGNYSPSDTNRAGTTAAFDLYDYIQEGYVRIAVIPVSGMAYVGYISSVSSGSSDADSVNVFDGGSISMSWASTDGGVTIPAGYRYLQLGFKRTDGANFPDVNYLADSFIVLELFKS